MERWAQVYASEFWCERGAGELSFYIEVFLKDDSQILQGTLDERSGGILDVGTNISMFSLSAAKRFPAATIYALEPNLKALPPADAQCSVDRRHEGTFGKLGNLVIRR